MTTYAIFYLMGHLTGAVADRNRHSILAVLAALWARIKP